MLHHATDTSIFSANMTTTAAAFISRIQTDPALLQKLQTSAPKSRAELATLLISLAAQEGVTLTSAEVEDHFATLDSSKGELSEEQLNAVSGGVNDMRTNISPFE